MTEPLTAEERKSLIEVSRRYEERMSHREQVMLAKLLARCDELERREREREAAFDVETLRVAAGFGLHKCDVCGQFMGHGHSCAGGAL